MSGDRCKADVPNKHSVTFRRCSRLAVEDGYCRQHHPSAEEARRNAAIKLFEERRERDPYLRAARESRLYKEQRDKLLDALKKAREYLVTADALASESFHAEIEDIDSKIAEIEAGS